MMKTITSIDQQLVKPEVQEDEKMGNIPGSQTYSEIISQGKVWKKTIANALVQLPALQPWLERTREEVYFIGCGSTFYLSLSAARIWNLLNRERSVGIPSSELWLNPEMFLSKRIPALVAISRSGETTETLNAIQRYKQLVNETPLCIGCYPASTMLRDSEFTLVAADAQEKSIAQTRSFSSMFILSQFIAAYAAQNESYMADLKCVPELFEKLIGSYEPLAKKIAIDLKYQHFVFLGSGINFGLASEAMLKMKEMSMSHSEVFHFLEFRHGPMSVISNKSLVIGLMSDKNRDEEMRVLKDMKQLGADTLALVEKSKGNDADYIIELESGVPQEARNILMLPFLQLLGFYTSIRKGLNPDTPTNLSTVVKL